MKKAASLGIHFEGRTGDRNSIVDVPGVEVGHETIMKDLQGNNGEVLPVRTGVTAVLPKGKANLGSDFFCGTSVLNGNGEVTGAAWIEESGMLSGPVMLTNTYSVGVVRDAVLKWMNANKVRHDALPVVCEISDEFLSALKGHHVSDSHVFSAIEKASVDNTKEGNVGGGTGAVCYEFKGGIGTSSRKIKLLGGEHTVGVMVQANHGLRHQLRVLGVPVGKHLRENLVRKRETGSIVTIIATDAPLLPHQLKRLSRRAYMGLGRTGSVSSDGSGDFSLAFSVANSYSHGSGQKENAAWIPNAELDALFEGAVQATEESIINALLAAESVRGIDGHFVSALPQEKLKELMSASG